MAIRLDKLVSERFGLSRRAAQDAVRLGRVEVEGQRCDEPGRMVPEDARVGYHPNRPKMRRVAGSDLRVLYEDRDVLVVDKPAGLLTLPTAAHESDTLVDRVAAYLKVRYGTDPYVGVAHRLDKETSGAILFARGPVALSKLQNMFRRHDVERAYVAVVFGRVERGAGVIDRRLVAESGRPRRRLARGGDEGVDAVTHYRVMERFGRAATLLACRLETGRTHQIRLHLSSIGHAVVGDRRYRPRVKPRPWLTFPRQALHAQTLGFAHPMTGEMVRVEAALPADFSRWIVELRNRFGGRD